VTIVNHGRTVFNDDIATFRALSPGSMSSAFLSALGTEA